MQEIGLISDQSGPLRLRLNISRGSGFEGGPLEDKGLSPAGQVVSVPNHRHAVELDFVRYELTAAYRFSDGWDAWLRMPYDVKQRSAQVEVVDPATEQEVAAMQRNLDLHHPSETLTGFSDFSLLVAHRVQDLLRRGDVFAAAAGSSIPVGRTEEDPYVLGDAGLPHEHIQFGSGTFDPLLEAYYVMPIAGPFRVLVNAQGRFPLYENDKGYRGPLEVSSGAAVVFAATDRLSLRAGWSFFYQGYAHWSGARDINSGLMTIGALAGIGYRVTDGAILTLDARVPVAQQTLSDDGDTFEQGAVVQLGVSYAF